VRITRKALQPLKESNLTEFIRYHAFLFVDVLYLWNFIVRTSFFGFDFFDKFSAYANT
jgi:hypothetical protein